MVLKWIYVYLSALTSAISSFMLLFFGSGCSDGGSKREGEIWNSDHGVDSLSVFSRESEWWRERERRRVRERKRRRGWCINILSSVWGQGERTEERGRGKGGGRLVGERVLEWVSECDYLFTYMLACVCASVIVCVVCLCVCGCGSEHMLTIDCTYNQWNDVTKYIYWSTVL